MFDFFVCVPGKERLAECLGITPHEAGHFIESFMQKYKKVHEFTKKTIGQCQNKGNPKWQAFFFFLIDHRVTMMKTEIPFNLNSRSYRTRDNKWYCFFVSPFSFSFIPKMNWLSFSAFPQKDARKVIFLFSGWTLLNVKLHYIISTYNVLQHKPREYFT